MIKIILRSLNIEKITYVGNYKNTNKKVYNVAGYKNNGTDCIYQEQTEMIQMKKEKLVFLIPLM